AHQGGEVWEQPVVLPAVGGRRVDAPRRCQTVVAPGGKVQRPHFAGGCGCHGVSHRTSFLSSVLANRPYMLAPSAPWAPARSYSSSSSIPSYTPETGWASTNADR